MDILSYVLPLAAMLKREDQLNKEVQEPKLPTFKRRFWFKTERLDARPVAWSLINRPDEWEWKNPGYTIVHKPSQHVFWIGNGWGFYHLYDANCGCSRNEGKFQRFQQGIFHRAYCCWRNGQMKDTSAEFAAHFIN